MSFLELRSITKTYPKSNKPCLSNLDLSMDEGEILVILGKSGCGKTTLLKVISGLEAVDTGDVIVNGESINSLAPYKRPISMVFQKPLLFRNMTVEENVNFSPRVKNTMNKEDLKRKTEEILKLVELENYGDRKTTQLSGGQEQRVSLARALMTEPAILLLDEPFAALDAELRTNMRVAVRRICKELNQTVIFVTHDQQEAVAMGDRIALMMDGSIVQCDKPDVFYHHPVSKKAAFFFGWNNALPGKQTGDKVMCQIGEVEIPGIEGDDRDVELLIHPQAAICTEGGRFAGKIVETVYMGTTSNYTVAINDAILHIQVSSRYLYSVGDEIRFDLDDSMIWPVPVVEETEVCEDEQPVKASGPKGLLSKLKKKE